MKISSWAPLLAICTLACQVDEASSTASSSAAPGASAQASGAPAAAVDGKGISAPDNDPALVALARKALACKWGPGGGAIDYSCADAKGWLDSPAASNPKAAPTLINFVEDSDPKVRALGAMHLSRASEGYKKDKALAARVIAAAQVDIGKTIDHEAFGYTVGDIDMQATGLLDTLKAAFPKLPSEMFRYGVLKKLVFQNAKNDAVYDYVFSLAKDPSAVVRGAAMAAFFSSGTTRRDDVCKMAQEMLGDANLDAASQAAASISSQPVGCDAPAYDALLDLIDRTYKAGKINGHLGSMAAQVLKSNKKPSDAQIKRAHELIRAMTADAKVPFPTRVSILEQLRFADKAFAKELAGKLESDADANVAKKAKEILAQS